MYLKRLEIQGFKSFAKPTTLEFQPGVTSIVGPNGSGKSNIADCLRWVLGEQSSKLMRGKKSEDVIFAGSDKRPRLSFAEVSATFDNQDHKIPVDAAEVSIGRRIDRSGESEYLINGNKVRLLDIIDLVLKSNIGTSRYTVIGQGTIDQMILAGPGEVKNLIDEASGVKSYYIKRERTLRRLEQTAQNLMRAEDLISELEPRVRSLRRQAKRMEARETLQVELKDYQKQFLGQNYWRVNGEVAAVSKELEKVLADRVALEKEIAAHLAAMENLEQDRIKELAKYQDQQGELQQIQNEKNSLLENLSLVRGKMQSQKSGVGDTDTLRVETHTITRKIQDVEKDLKAARDSRETLASQQQQQKQQLEQLSAAIEKVYAQLSSPAGANWQSLETEFNSLDQQMNDYWSALPNLPDLAAAVAAGQELRQKWVAFRDLAKTISGHAQPAVDSQNSLQELSVKKESLAASLNSIAVEQSKLSVTESFLSQQLKDLEQEKLRLDLELKQAGSSSSEDFWEQMVAEEKTIQDKIDAAARRAESAQRALAGLYEAEATFKNSISEKDKQFRDASAQVNSIRDKESGIQIQKAKKESGLEVIVGELRQALGEDGYKEVASAPITDVPADLADKIEKLKHQLELIGGIDELTMQEYRETEDRYTSLSGQVNDLKKAVEDLRTVMDELDNHIKTAFNEAFHKVQTQFEQYFRTLFNGGRAYLSLIRSGEEAKEEELEETETEEQNSLRPEEKLVARYEKGNMNVAGVEIKATPPGKKLSTIQSLSGGERALTSIALLCSLLACFPSPFVVLDEVDAALDEANTIRFGQILGSLAHQTQFITITHNRETMAQSSMLYGVTMGDDGVSKLLSIKFDQATVFAK
jgi:chromosome segregation protein